MGDGSRKPIDQIKVGDKVMATDPVTGKTGPRTVLTTFGDSGTKNMVRVTVDTDGERGTKTGTLQVTDNHPFWIPALKQWVDAGKLKPGMWLRTSAGTHVQISAINTWTRHQQVHNLTVESDHTYYAAAGTTPVLVHNCGSFDPQTGRLTEDAFEAYDKAFGPQVADGVEYQAMRMHDGTEEAADHVLPGLGHDTDALALFFDSLATRNFTHVDPRFDSGSSQSEALLFI
ncbi:hypothetical protein Acsp04_18650 [Actinomadura sp. NBRC 104425]|nr:hypothetical protein Acsp04_18650 [Actinomadura sp. NBRC 104425]